MEPLAGQVCQDHVHEHQGFTLVAGIAMLDVPRQRARRCLERAVHILAPQAGPAAHPALATARRTLDSLT